VYLAGSVYNFTGRVQRQHQHQKHSSIISHHYCHIAHTATAARVDNGRLVDSLHNVPLKTVWCSRRSSNNPNNNNNDDDNNKDNLIIIIIIIIINSYLDSRFSESTGCRSNCRTSADEFPSSSKKRLKPLIFLREFQLQYSVVVRSPS